MFSSASFSTVSFSDQAWSIDIEGGGFESTSFDTAAFEDDSFLFETLVLPISEYVAWLRADNQTRIVLVEAHAYSGGAVVARYMSNGDFISEPTDTPANIAYADAAVLSVQHFTSRMSEQFTGRSTPAWGDIDIANDSGELDSWINDGWDGRAVSLYFGDPAWDKADFQLLMSGMFDDIYAKDQRTLSLKLRDKQWALNVPAQTNLIGGTTANTDQPVPQTFGPVSNIEPVLIDSATSEYQVHDGQIEGISEVRDNGVSVAFTADLSTGTFVLTAAPEGRITADVQGAKPSGVYLTKCADIMRHLITTHTILTTADIDSASFTAFNSTCPQTLGLYIRDRQNLLDVLDSLISSVGGWYTPSRAGLLQLGRLESPSGTAVAEFTADDVVEGDLRCARRITPVTSVRLGYQKNWTVQTDGLAGIVSEADRAEFGAEYLVAKATDPSITTAHPLALEPDVEGTLLTTLADTETEAARRLALHGVVRHVYAGEFFAAPLSVSIGYRVSLTHPRFGFDSGDNAIIVGFSESPTTGRIELELWK